MSSDDVFSLRGKRVWVAGHRGLVGSAIVRRLQGEGCSIVTATRAEVDLRDPARVDAFVGRERPDVVFMAAAKVGGILVNNSFPADFLYDNLMIAANVTDAAHRHRVGKMLFLGSSCIYPRMAHQPISESALLAGPLEPTNEWYAVAKIAGIKLAQAYRRQHGCDFISAMPTNIYGIGDNFDLDASHVLPALIRKAHEAKVAEADHFVLWGTGAPRREFLHADDCADACVFLMKRYSGEEHVNVGSGQDISIIELAQIIREVVGFKGQIRLDLSKPDGAPRKLMSDEKLRAMGWVPSKRLRDGIEAVYQAVKVDF